MIFRPILTAMAAGILCISPALAEESASPIGKQIEPFVLDNCYGKAVSLDDFADREAIALVFLGTECPLAKLYGPRLQELQKDFDKEGKKVAIIGVNSNTQDSMTELQRYREKHEMKDVPMLKDVGNRVADALGAERTPEVFLLDQDFVVRYHGQIDGQYLVGKTLAREYPEYLKDAINQLLAGEPIELASTEPEGCFIGKVSKTAPTGTITYTKHIAPIFNEHCVKCHREQEIAPFTLTNYEDIQGWEDTILEVIDEQEGDDGELLPPRMPPWFADPKHGKFANDARLSAAEKDLIFEWVENGMPEGDPADLPEPPEFTLGWQIPEPDEIFKLTDSKVVEKKKKEEKERQILLSKEGYHVPAEGIVDYQYSYIKPDWKEDKWVYAAEARPGNRSVVHHIIAYVIHPGEEEKNIRHMLAGYAPGAVPMKLPEGVAFKVPAGSTILFEMHYTPNGTTQTDISEVGVCYLDADEVERSAGQLIAIEHEFEIPPRAENKQVFAYTQVEKEVELLTLTPHMHLRGSAFTYEYRLPKRGGWNTDKDGWKTILSVPNYDFNWQLTYKLEDPITLPRGTQIRCTAWYDNSENNVSNPNPDETVIWGDQSDQEMMIGFMGTIEPLPSHSKKTTAKAKPNEVSQR